MILSDISLKYAEFKIIHKPKNSKVKLNNITNNPFKLLSDYDNFDFKFVKYINDTYKISNIDNFNLEVFGMCNIGFFGIADNGCIFMISNGNIDYKQKITYVNKNLELFIDCYSIFISIIFLSKVQNKNNIDISIKYLESFILDNDNIALSDNCFWKSIIFFYKSNNFPLSIPISKYLADEKLLI